MYLKNLTNSDILKRRKSLFFLGDNRDCSKKEFLSSRICSQRQSYCKAQFIFIHQIKMLVVSLNFGSLRQFITRFLRKLFNENSYSNLEKN